jgi:glutaredoxin
MKNPAVRNAVLAFIIASAIFATGFWVSDSINGLRVKEIQSIQQQISIDTLSLETQFDLLAQLSCSALKENSVLSSELNNLADRLDYTEGQLGSNNATVLQLKRQYSLLEIKDYLLMQQVAVKCDLKPVFVLYFYSNAGDCEKCESAGRVLSYLRETYPQLRVYSFDYNLNLGAIETLIAINKIQNTLPAFVVNGKSYYGVSDLDALKEILPLDKLSTSTPKSKAEEN